MSCVDRMVREGYRAMSTRSLTPADTPQPASTTVAAHKQHDRPFQVLVVDQDLNDRHAVVDYLRRQGMSVTWGGEWSDVEHLFAELEFDLVILDLSISEKGLSLLSDIRFQHDFPLIVTTAPQVGEDERAVVLELGADDCISKPFGLRELAAHIRAVLRRSVRANGASPACSLSRHCRFGGWHVDRRSRKLTSPDGADVPLTKGQYALLAAFIDAPLITLSRECPSSDDLRLVRRFVKGGSGSSGLEFKRPATDAASVGWRWLHA